MRPVRCGNDLAERLADDALGAREARPLGVRRVAEQQVDAAVAELRELADVRPESVDRRVVELPVAGVEDAAGGVSIATPTASGTECAIAHELEPERAELDGGPSGSISRSSVERWRPCSSSFDADRRASAASPTPRRRDLAQEVRQRADVILVGVREHHRAHLAVPR